MGKKKTGVELRDEIISKMVDDITKPSNCVNTLLVDKSNSVIIFLKELKKAVSFKVINVIAVNGKI